MTSSTIYEFSAAGNNQTCLYFSDERLSELDDLLLDEESDEEEEDRLVITARYTKFHIMHVLKQTRLPA